MVLKGILSDSESHYKSTKIKIERKLSQLPQGSIKKRKIAGHLYYYFQQRNGDKVVHKYLGKVKPQQLIIQIHQRKVFKSELKKVNEALKILKRAKGRAK